MTDPLRAAILGIVEGLTEFLPVSSTGHMILVEPLLGIPEGDPFWSGAFDIFIQIGAILAVLVYFWRRLYRLALPGTIAAASAPAEIREFRGPAGTLEYASPMSARPRRWYEHILVKLFVAFLPAAVVGKLAADFIESHLKTPPVVAGALIVGGIAIILIERCVRQAKYTDAGAIPLRVAFAIGVAQCLAMIPGTSRSAATIMGALVLGLSAPAAAEFSFFLAIPTMIGAFAYDFYKNRAEMSADHVGILAIGFVVSFITAMIVVKTFLTYVQRHGFVLFAWWRVIIGTVGLIALALGK